MAKKTAKIDSKKRYIAPGIAVQVSFDGQIFKITTEKGVVTFRL